MCQLRASRYGGVDTVTDARANIKVGREFYERHNDRRQELGLTWEEYIDGQAPEFDVSVDYAEIERRCEKALESVRPR